MRADRAENFLTDFDTQLQFKSFKFSSNVSIFLYVLLSEQRSMVRITCTVLTS